MSDKARIHATLNSANIREDFDNTSFERCFAPTAIFYDEDFIGAAKGGAAFPTSATLGSDWVKKLVGAGTPTVAGVASAAFGAVQLALDATSEKQEATLYWADNKHVDVTKGLVFEARVKLSVLPSASGVQAVWGLANSWIDGPDNNTYYLEFGATANGNILMRTQDGVNQNSNATAVTVLTSDWHLFRIDATTLTDIKFSIDGVQYSTNAQMAFAATGANAILQPYVSVYKPSGTGLATAQVDKVMFYSNRQ